MVTYAKTSPKLVKPRGPAGERRRRSDVDQPVTTLQDTAKEVMWIYKSLHYSTQPKKWCGSTSHYTTGHSQRSDVDQQVTTLQDTAKEVMWINKSLHYRTQPKKWCGSTSHYTTGHSQRSDVDQQVTTLQDTAKEVMWINKSLHYRTQPKKWCGSTSHYTTGHSQWCGSTSHYTTGHSQRSDVDQPVTTLQDTAKPLCSATLPTDFTVALTLTQEAVMHEATVHDLQSPPNSCWHKGTIVTGPLITCPSCHTPLQLLWQDHSCCDRTTPVVTGPLLWQDHSCCDRTTPVVTGPLLLWQDHSCCDRTTPVTGPLLLWQDHSCCDRTTPVTGPLLLWQDHSCCDRTTPVVTEPLPSPPPHPISLPYTSSLPSWSLSPQAACGRSSPLPGQCGASRHPPASVYGTWNATNIKWSRSAWWFITWP